jgi:translation initiation factor IF-1
VGDQARSVEGTVVEALPSALYRVEIEGRHRITAHLGDGPDRNFVRVLVGDRVVVELTPRDLSRGRIVRKA